MKELDQESRGALRKHGVRFGQFTIFMPLLLKPAPTRLRLVLWSLSKGLQEFPEAPPPGLVTVPTDKDAPDGYATMAGYRAAGERSIRIDMLERLADMLRAEDSRGGFEAKADMLSITGMTLEQFADLMQGLGYKAEKGEREKVKPAPAADSATETAPGGSGPSDKVDSTPPSDPAAEDAAQVVPDKLEDEQTTAGQTTEEVLADAGAAPENVEASAEATAAEIRMSRPAADIEPSS